MQIKPQPASDALIRIKRARGQLECAIEMMKTNGGCPELLTHLTAVSHSLDRADEDLQDLFLSAAPEAKA
ncbi:Metal-sensitive transcriptional repressor [Actinopolymorpha cephalotaxi]|uniref:DNA-binding FrmR family transcriptional regulator n=1 Tax=Actinopolymorpha cephalotaxi TaxID=504797 RepID=A0A1I3C1S6_9ACTN|nr:metal-sensing transcriptional repressor [Actinopolymorpha cephalotaxi]NYH84087.1 DNA-binding FrmR family transcriptional regulator [Actinopolymorpha cephalotaxi]SFH68558.1 Metal-sensitive transcriptional repressor [Actinopolymorpha cephalotaxi]